MKTEHTDACQLRLFAQRMQSHAHRSGRDLQEAIREVGGPIVRQLQLNGHDLADAVALLRATLQTLNLYERGKP